ncbi:uncharacterized acetyltransferase At3g50280-like [Nymphaea colorata]|nr:uncharacterized acetyltransferase At3g50280-like [Nymphaea colorata]
MSSPKVSVLSTSPVRLPQPLERSPCHLTVVGFVLLSDAYMHNGLLYSKPAIPFDDVVQQLRVSLSNCLLHFYPLAGRLATDPETTVFVDCNNDGAQLVVAACHDISVSDLICAGDVPAIVKSFFPLIGAVNHDGHSLPLFAVQVTELADGVFIACSCNHSVGDGQSFWHFMNSWSELSRGNQQISRKPVMIHASEPIHYIPTKEEVTSIEWLAGVREHIFHFSRKAVVSLKAKANQQGEMEKGEISSLQALTALIWRAITRARALEAEQTTNCWLAVEDRRRCNPPMPEEYFGTCIGLACATSTAGELLGQELGLAARAIHEKIANYIVDAKEEKLKGLLRERRPRNPAAFFGRGGILVAGSPRFDIYGNDFGWGRPMSSFNEPAATIDGKVVASQGREGIGSVDLEVCLPLQTMRNLLLDEELREALASN